MNALVSGALIMGYAVIALYFLRFWATSRDRLFAYFASAFAILSVQRLAIVLTRETLEDQTLFYVLRLVAFLLIMWAIIDKNRR